MAKNVFVNSPPADWQIMRVLRFMREYLHITTKEISEAMEGDYHSRSLIASIENRFRNPDIIFIVEYAKVIQEKSGLKGNLLYIAQKCIEDKFFLELMDKYEKNSDFRTIYKISSKINQLNLNLSSSTKSESL